MDKPKVKKPRMRSCKSQLRSTLDEIAVMLASPTLREVSKAGLLQSKLSCLQSLLLMESEERKIKLKLVSEEILLKENADLRKENERLRAELGKVNGATKEPVKTEASFEERLAKRLQKEETCTQA
jgi:hypothetical protein